MYFIPCYFSWCTLYHATSVDVLYIFQLSKHISWNWFFHFGSLFSLDFYNNGCEVNVRQIRYCFVIEEACKLRLFVEQFLESCKTFRKVRNGSLLFLNCMLVCISDRRGCSDLFLLFTSVFWVWRAFL